MPIARSYHDDRLDISREALWERVVNAFAAARAVRVEAPPFPNRNRANGYANALLDLWCDLIKEDEEVAYERVTEALSARLT